MLKMEAERSSETLVTTCQTTQRHNPEYRHRQLHRHEKNKISDNVVFIAVQTVSKYSVNL
jgi:hypothetical protein